MNKITLIIIFGVCLYLFSSYCGCYQTTETTDNKELSKVKREQSNGESKLRNDPRIIIDSTTVKPFDILSSDRIEQSPESKIIQTPNKSKIIQSHDDINNKVIYNKTNIVMPIIDDDNTPKPYNYVSSLITKQNYIVPSNIQQNPKNNYRPSVPVPVLEIITPSQEIGTHNTSYLPVVGNNEFIFDPKPINDYKIPKKSFEEKYWDIDNNKFTLLENSILTNGKFFSGVNDILAPEVASGGLKTGYPSECNPIISENNIITKDSDYPPKVLTYNGNDYKIFGLASNKYYNIYFIVYEREVYFDEPNIYNNKLYEYVLVKLVNNKLQIMHSMQPRTHIVMGDYVSFNFGVSQLNFLLVTSL